MFWQKIQTSKISKTKKKQAKGVSETKPKTAVHDVEPKKIGTLLWQVDETSNRFLITLVVYFLEEYGELSKSVDFGQKLSYFTDQNGPKGEPHENEFWLFSNTKMNVTNS